MSPQWKRTRCWKKSWITKGKYQRPVGNVSKAENAKDKTSFYVQNKKIEDEGMIPP